jgi:CheY-like chemotaxis protein
VREVALASLNLARGQILGCARLVVNWSATRHVWANRAQLGQIFMNLLVNACEAIEPGHPESNTISIASRDDGDMVEVVVKDTGIGILPSELDQIFDLFYTTKAVGSGPGLGLSICHDLVEALGGSIHVASEVGRWTELRVRLPGALAAPSQKLERNEPNVWQRAKRLLVVDDDPLVARSVRRLLGGDQHVTLAPDGRSALEELRKNRYDIILCDVVMPEMDGVSLLEAVRVERPAAASRFVFMTGSLFDCESRQRIQAVSAPCVNKPLDIAELTLALAQVLDAAQDTGSP